jgi:tetratricopeptide (TPR) repeat protein
MQETRDGLIVACRDLLRHLGHPARLRTNSIVRGSLLDDADDTALIAGVRALVSDALELLTQRQRSIILRCDLGGELAMSVAAALAISRRHLFRERAQAIAIMSKHILDRLRHGRSAPTVLDPLASQLALAQSFEQTGDWRCATEILEDTASRLDDATSKWRVLLRLSQLYVHAGRYAHGADRIAAAARVVAGRPESWRTAATDAFAAAIVWQTDGGIHAQEAMRSALQHLRASHVREGGRDVTETLIEALLASCELDLEQGRFAAATTTVCEIGDLYAEAPHLPNALRLNIRTMRALVDLFSRGDLESAERALLVCYDRALSAGLTRDAILVTTHLSGVYRALRQPKQVVALLRDVLPAARALGHGEALGGVLIELAWAHLQLHRASDALAYLEEAQPSVDCNDRLACVGLLLGAYANCGLQRYAQALRQAEAAENRFMRRGWTRFAGRSLLIQSKALTGLGKYADSARTTRIACNILGAVDPFRSAIV